MKNVNFFPFYSPDFKIDKIECYKTSIQFFIYTGNSLTADPNLNENFYSDLRE